MLRLSRQMSVLDIASFYLFYCLVTEVHSLECRIGFGDNYIIRHIIYQQETCAANETACFQSVKYSKFSDTAVKDYKWRCINGKECSNRTGHFTAYYEGTKGMD